MISFIVQHPFRLVSNHFFTIVTLFINTNISVSKLYGVNFSKQSNELNQNINNLISNVSTLISGSNNLMNVNNPILISKLNNTDGLVNLKGA